MRSNAIMLILTVLHVNCSVHSKISFFKHIYYNLKVSVHLLENDVNLSVRKHYCALRLGLKLGLGQGLGLGLEIGLWLGLG